MPIESGLENLDGEKKAMTAMLTRLKEQAREFLDVTGDSLRDFIVQVVEESPDVIIFLDNSARIFGTPIKKYLSKLSAEGKIESAPEIAFYNDADLKDAMKKHGQGNKTEDIIKKDFSGLCDKKIFFFDEVFAMGKGAGAIQKIKENINNENIYYFALSSLPQSYIPPEIAQNEKFKIYNNTAPNLFPMEASRLHTKEFVNREGRTITYAKKHAKSDLKEKMKIPNYYLSGSATSDEIERSKYAAVGEIKSMIYRELEKQVS